MELEFKIVNKYFLLSESLLTQKKSDKSDLPSLPKDVVLSFINNSEFFILFFLILFQIFFYFKLKYLKDI